MGTVGLLCLVLNGAHYGDCSSFQHPKYFPVPPVLWKGLPEKSLVESKTRLRKTVHSKSVQEESVQPVYFLRYLFIPICSLQWKKGIHFFWNTHWSKADKVPNFIFKKDHSGSATNVVPQRGTPLRCFTIGQAMLLKVLFACVHKWCTHLRKRVFGQFNLCKRLPSVWHIVICSSTSCHLWKHQRKWVMALARHPTLTPVRGFNNYFFQVSFLWPAQLSLKASV